MIRGAFINGPLAGSTVTSSDGEPLVPILDECGQPVYELELPREGYYALADFRRPARIWEFTAKSWHLTKLLDTYVGMYRWTTPDDVDDSDLRWLR